MRIFNLRICLLIVAIFSVLSFCAQAQTYAYKYSHSVKDGVKVPGFSSKSVVFYFTFTNGKGMCYLTDENGVYTGGDGGNSYRFIGTKNGMHVYQEQNQNMFRQGQDMLYFSSDFSKMNWKCTIDMYSSYPGCIRVLNYVSDPNEVEVPSQLY